MTRLERWLLVGFPAACLVTSFVVICVHFRTAWPWAAMVHESGTRNLVETIFYFDHALGELPLDILIAGATGGAALWFFAPRPGSAQFIWLWTAIALAVDGSLFVGSWLTAGLPLSLSYLMQYVTRPDAPFEFGSHWRYHLISQIALLALPIVLVSAVELLGRRASPGPHGAGMRILAGSWILFAALSFIFGLNAKPLIDPQYLGHQARELFTHSLVTVPLAIALCLLLSLPKAEAFGSRNFPWQAFAIATSVCAISAVYLLAGIVTKSSYSHAQSSDPVRVVCGHFFEHSFSYLVVPSHAVAFYLLGGRYLKGANS